MVFLMSQTIPPLVQVPTVVLLQSNGAQLEQMRRSSLHKVAIDQGNTFFAPRHKVETKGLPRDRSSNVLDQSKEFDWQRASGAVKDNE